MAVKKSLISQAAEGFSKLPYVKQAFFVVALSASIATGVTMVMWMQEPTYRPLYTQLDADDIILITDTLQKNNIPFKISDRDGTVLVPASALHRAKIRLGGAGFKHQSGISMDFLEKGSGIGTSRFIESARYLHALENEMGRTISGIQGIKAARVHLAIPKQSVFLGDKRQPTASVFIKLARGYNLEKTQANAIVQMVAASIIGLKPKHVMVTDQYGNLLTPKLNDQMALSQEQLNYQQRMQKLYEKRIESVLYPLLGRNNVRVSVYANVDFTYQRETKQEYDPNNRTVVSEQTTNEKSSGGAGGAPGALTNQAGGGGQAGGGAKGGGSRNQSVKNYEVGKSIKIITSPGGLLKNLSVAVVVDDIAKKDPKTGKVTTSPVPKQKLDKIDALVKAAIGYDEKRGDKINVINSAFAPIKQIEAPPPLPIYQQAWVWDIVKQGGAVLLALIFAFGFLRPMLKNLAKKAETDGEEGSTETDAQGQIVHLTPEMTQLKKDQLESLKKLVAQDPQKVGKVLKNWVGAE